MNSPKSPQLPWIQVAVTRQILTLHRAAGEVVMYPVSTARSGTGQQLNSGRTPLGSHYIRAMIGASQPLGAVFVGRRPTGEIFSAQLATEHPQRDWILSRILWLCGREVGRNRLGNVDTQRRLIYIHGTPDSEPMGVPHSHGCIRMCNADVIALFDQVTPGVRVEIAP